MAAETIDDAASQHLKAFHDHLEVLSHQAITPHDAQQELVYICQAIVDGKLGRRRDVTKQHVVDAVGKFRNRTGVWSTDAARQLGSTLLEINRQAAEPALPSAQHKPSWLAAQPTHNTQVVCPACHATPSVAVGSPASAECGSCGASLPTGGTQLNSSSHDTTHTGDTTVDVASSITVVQPSSSTPNVHAGVDGNGNDGLVVVRGGGGGRAMSKVTQCGVCIYTTARKKPVILCLLLFFGVWFGALLFAFGAMANHLAEEAAAGDWVEGPCTFNSGRVIEECGDSCSYRYEAEVTLVVGGSTYTETACPLATCIATAWDSEKAEEFAAQYTAGETYSCWYDPDNPSDVKLTDEVASPVGGIFALVFIVIFMVSPCYIGRKRTVPCTRSVCHGTYAIIRGREWRDYIA